MRVSSSAPALSRRSIMRGMAAALIGASVPAAAIAGLTARKLTVGDDTELLNACRDWHARRRQLKRMEKNLLRLYRDAESKTPPKAKELFEPIHVSDGLPLYHPNNGALDNPPDGSWARSRLVFYSADRPFDPNTTPYVGPAPECQAHCRRLLTFLDKHQAEAERLLVPYRRLDRQWDQENAKHWRQFKRIIRTRADTLQGAAAQLKVIELEGALTDAHSDAVNRHVLAVARNIGRLVAAQSAGA